MDSTSSISIGWAVAAAVVYFSIGAVWYSPLLFAKTWQAEIKKLGNQTTTAAPAMVTTAIAILVIVLTERALINNININGMPEAIKLAVTLWLGLVASTALINNTFQNGSLRLLAINQGYHLVGMVVAAAILVR